jgi:hypothetical protein
MVAQVARYSLAVLCGDASRDVKRVADERMSGGSKVDTYLVRPARRNPDLKQRTVLTPFKDMDMAVCWLPGRACGMDGLQDLVRHWTDRSVNFKFVGGRAPGS